MKFGLFQHNLWKNRHNTWEIPLVKARYILCMAYVYMSFVWEINVMRLELHLEQNFQPVMLRWGVVQSWTFLLLEDSCADPPNDWYFFHKPIWEQIELNLLFPLKLAKKLVFVFSCQFQKLHVDPKCMFSGIFWWFRFCNFHMSFQKV